MAEVYSRNMMKVALAKILQTIGWNSANSTPLEILTDIMVYYVAQLGTSVHDYANEFGCTEPSLDHLALAFRDFHINLSDLEEYVSFIDFVPPPTMVPKYPVAKESNLNFLKPGSKEVITRPVHVHEHLPPMHPAPEETEAEAAPTRQAAEIDIETTPPVFKKPADLVHGDSFKKLNKYGEEEGRPTREISSVMMTTSGYISPAREGKLPEAKTPVQAHEAPPSPVDDSPAELAINLPQCKPTASLNPPPAGATDNISTPKIRPGNARRFERIERKKLSKELFKPDPSRSQAPKKLEKLKKPKASKVKKELDDGAAVTSSGRKTGANQKSPSLKASKASAAARLKPDKLGPTVQPTPNKIDKLFSEPDKKKINILKKISNVRNDKDTKTGKTFECKQENEEAVADDVDRKPDISTEMPSALPPVEKQEKLYFDDDSPPGTPSTPKTPEMMTNQSPSLPMTKEKRKDKEKSKSKKAAKAISPGADVSFTDMERPKTPEAHVPPVLPPTLGPPTFPQFPHFPSFFGGPGLIPSQLVNPLLPMNPLFGPNVSMPPYMPSNAFPAVPPHKPEPHRAKRKASHMDEVDATASPADVPLKSPRLDAVKKKKDKKDKIKKKNKKDKLKSKEEKKRLKEEKKDKAKKEKKEKRKEKNRENVNLKLTFKFGKDSSPRPEVGEKKLNIKPIVKREGSPPRAEIKREMSPELAKISALVTGHPKPKLSPVAPLKEEVKEEAIEAAPVARTHPGPGRPRIHPIKQKPIKASKRQIQQKDLDGNEVWICPACGRQDDGSPMIGCDDCDAWYHWVCVGIQVPPDENENWYCRQCIIKKEEVMHSEKKKKRKKREKKDH